MGADEGPRPDSLRPADDQIRDGLSPTEAFDYSSAFTERAVELVPDLDPDAMLLFVLLARVARLTSYDFESSVHRPEGLSYSSFYLVALLALLGPTEHARLATASGMSRASVSALAKTLERDGWVVRSTPEQDRRSVVLTLSERGRARVPGLFQRLNDREQTWSSSLAPEERTELISLLRRLLEGAPHDGRYRH